MLILFYIVFYLVRNYAWIEEIDLRTDEPIISSEIHSPSLFIPSTSIDTTFQTSNWPDSVVVPSRKKTNRKKKKSYKPYDHQPQTQSIISVNKANQKDWEKLYNIGPYRAGQILKFRDALGGFYTIDQVGETYGLPDSVFQQIKPQLRADSDYMQININQVVYDSLYPHPYITKQMAYYIAKYRNTGTIHDMNALYKIIPEKDHERLRKLEPYLYFGIR